MKEKKTMATPKLNSFTVSLWDKRKEVLNPFSTVTEAFGVTYPSPNVNILMVVFEQG